MIFSFRYISPDFLKRYPKEIENLDKIKVSLYYLKHGVKLSSQRTLEQIKQSEQLIVDLD